MSFSRAGTIKLIQRGTISFSNTSSTTAALTGVVTGKSELAHLGVTGGSGGGPETHTYLSLTSSVLIAATRNSTGSQLSITSYQVTERY